MFLSRGIAKQVTRFASGVRTPTIYILSNWKIKRADVFQRSCKFPIAMTSDNLCLVMAKSRPSDNLLLKASEVHKVPTSLSVPKNRSLPGCEISLPTIFELTDWFIEESICSENCIELFPLTETFEYEQVPNVVLEISKNLLDLLSVPDIFGQLFSRKIDCYKNIGDVENNNNLVVKSKKSQDKIPDRLPNEWDLFLPVLLPPLSLEFPKKFDFYQALRGYQQQGISWLVEKPSALLADEMGTGKTVQAVNALRLLFRQGKIRSALIVCPPAVIGSIDLTIETGSSEGWCGHLYHWASELEIAVMRGGNQEQRKLAWEHPFHVYVTTYDTLRLDILNKVLTDYNKFDCIILDEAQKIKNRDSKTSKSIRYLQSKYRWALTGTPIENCLEDVKSLFYFIYPGLFNSNLEDSPQSVKIAIEPYMLRRLKQDVLQDLPDKVRQEDWLILDEHQKADYDRVLQTGRKKIETSLGVEPAPQVTRHIFALLGELKQICNFAKGHSESPKTELLLEYVEIIAANKKKVLIFSQYCEEGTNKIANLLKRKKIEYVLYTGQVSTQHKNQAVSNFRDNPDITVFLATIDTAGYGITLTEATYVIHFDHPWNPAKMQNAEDRTHRIGQKSSVTVYSFWMIGTVEERIKNKLDEKRLLIESTVDDLAVETIDKNSISTEDWLDILGIQSPVKTIEVEAKAVDKTQPEEHTKKISQTQKISIESSHSRASQPIKSTERYHHMSNDRLHEIEKNLELLRQDIAGREKAKILAAFEEKTRIELGIQELRKQMMFLEEECQKLIAARAAHVETTEPKLEYKHNSLDKIKVLFLAANPSNTPPLKLDEEFRSVKQKIRASEYRDSLQLISEWAVRSDDLLQLLNEHKPHIVHFSGHGSNAREIILVDDKGISKPVSTKALQALFMTLKDNIRAVILNACYSEIQAKAITKVIDCAIGMSSSIGDSAAITFAASFYRAIGFGRSTQEAFEQGITALLLEGVSEEDTPQLMTKNGVDPSQLFFIVQT